MAWRETFQRLEAASRGKQRKGLRDTDTFAPVPGGTNGGAPLVYSESQLERLIAVHRKCGKKWNWAKIADQPPPESPSREHSEQRLVEAELNVLGTTPSAPLRTSNREQSTVRALEAFNSSRQPNTAFSHSEIENPKWEAVVAIPPPLVPVRGRNRQAPIELMLAECVEPKPPDRADVRTLEAQARLDSFSPGALDKFLGTAEKQRQKLLRTVEIARDEDESEYQSLYRGYVERFESWRQERERLVQALESARAEDEAEYQQAHQSYVRDAAGWDDQHRLAEMIVAVKRGPSQDEKDFQDACLRYNRDLVVWEHRHGSLLQKLELARANDEVTYQQACDAHHQATLEWAEHCELARRIVADDRQVCLEVLEATETFAEVKELGFGITFRISAPRLVEVRLAVNLDRVIPSEVRVFSSGGRPIVKPMSKTRYWELARDHVCSCSLRIGREVFALLPSDFVLTTVVVEQLDTSTGHLAEQPILSVVMPREPMDVLNFDSINPSDALANFKNRIDFRKTKGFAAVTELTWDDAYSTGESDEEGGQGLAKDSERSVVALERLLADSPPMDGCHWIPGGIAAGLVGIGQEEKLTIGVCRRLADAIEAAGYCIEPDARFGSGVYDRDQMLGIFKPAEGESVVPSPAYHGAANLLKLSVLVAAADGAVDPHELIVFRQVIESQLHFSQTELKRLAVLERLLTGDTASAAKTLAKVAKAVPADKRLLVGQVLVKVAAVDHLITKSEYRALERVFKAFELPPQTLADLMLEVCPAPEEATIQEGQCGSPGEDIPQRGMPEKPKGFSLDMSKVYAITNETKEVVGILAVVMEDEQDETPAPSRSSAPPQPHLFGNTAPSRDGETASPARFIGLDPTFHPVLERLLAKASWPQSDFDALAGEFHLMPLSIHDVINEWADESLGDFLLNGEDPILVRRELIITETN